MAGHIGALKAPLAFGLVFGSLVVIRAALDGGSAGIAVTAIMFLFFAGVAAAAYFGVALLGRGPLVTAMLTALLILVLVTLPALAGSTITRMAAVRIGVRIAVAWIYVCAGFAALRRFT